MKNLLFPINPFKSRLLLGVAIVALSLIASTTAQAYQYQTNFNTGSTATVPPVSAPFPIAPASAPYLGWEHWVPDAFGTTGSDGNGGFTNPMNLPSVTFVTNNISAGNLGIMLHAGTTNAGGFFPPRVASFFTNGPSLANYTMAADFYGWTNGQGQEFGLAGRVQVPLAPINVPNEETGTNSDAPNSIILVWANARSAKAFQLPTPATGSSDNLRMYWVPPGENGFQPSPARLTSQSLNGPGANYTVGRSLSPVPTGRYRLLFTASGLNLTAQMVDLSTGLPMNFGDVTVTNMIRRLAYYTNAGTEYYLTNNGSIFTNGVLDTSRTVPLGGNSGLIAVLGSSGTSAPIPGNNTVGQPLDPKFDNYSIVPGVVTLETASVVTGPYTQDTRAGIDLYNKRITIPTDGDQRFYRINWIGADHTPAITGIAFGPTVNIVIADSINTTSSTTVNTVVLDFN